MLEEKLSHLVYLLGELTVLLNSYVNSTETKNKGNLENAKSPLTPVSDEEEYVGASEFIKLSDFSKHMRFPPRKITELCRKYQVYFKGSIHTRIKATSPKKIHGYKVHPVRFEKLLIRYPFKNNLEREMQKEYWKKQKDYLDFQEFENKING